MQTSVLRWHLLICVFFFLFLSTVSGQGKKDSLTVADSSQFASPETVLLQSTILPGYGQISQDRLWTATFFYGMTATFYYRAIYHHSRYKKTDNKNYLYKAQSDLSIAVLTHLLNIIDVYDTAKNNEPLGWGGALFSDKPVKSPWGATLRSAIFPGWGQIYNEEYLKAGVYIALVAYLGNEIIWNKEKYRETGKNKYADDRSRYSWYLGFTYLLMLTDAHVDAHLFDFDKAVKLAIIPDPINSSLSLGLTVPF